MADPTENVDQIVEDLKALIGEPEEQVGEEEIGEPHGIPDELIELSIALDDGTAAGTAARAEELQAWVR